MKNIFKYVCVLLFMVIGNSAVKAQSTGSAESILNKVSAVYGGYKTIKADFLLKGEASDKSAFSERGRVYLVPGTNQFKIETPNNVIVSDGKTQWSVFKDLQEVQVTNYERNSQSIDPASIFTIHQKGFKMKKLADSSVGGKSLFTIELQPQTETQNIRTIKLRVNKDSYFIHDAVVQDTNGNTYVYTLTNIETNRTFSKGIFIFHEHNFPGIEVVDLR